MIFIKKERKQVDIEKQRRFWAGVAKKYGWFTNPFYVQVWVNKDGTIQDSVSFKGMTGDVIIELED